jgi:hypothetical protein
MPIPRPEIVVAEGNEFLWPGYDLRKLPHSDRYDYGFLPPKFFDHVREAFGARSLRCLASRRQQLPSHLARLASASRASDVEW